MPFADLSESLGFSLKSPYFLVTYHAATLAEEDPEETTQALLAALDKFPEYQAIVTYPNAGPLQEVAREVPHDLFLVETDCPFLAPQKYRGERNEPAYVVEVVEKIAELKGMSVSEVSEISTANAKRFFERLA